MLEIDRKNVTAQLSLLGYQAGDAVFLRSFFPSEDPRKQTDKGRKLKAHYPQPPWSELERLQQEGRGIYVVVNGGGHKDAAVTVGRAIFYEHDVLEKSVQADLWQSLDLPEPTFQMDTGGKSIHSYWVFETPIPIKDWRTLQADLLEFAGGDLSIKNPSRVMRLAGCFHVGPGRLPVQSRIVSAGGQRYGFDLLRAAVPKQEPTDSPKLSWAAFTRIFSAPYPSRVPLYDCLSRQSRDLIDNGVDEGSRNTRGAALARDLIGTAEYLRDIGQTFESHERQLFEQYCDVCSPPIAQAEREAIWTSALKSNPSPACCPEQIATCIRGSVWRALKKSPHSEQAKHLKMTDGKGDQSLFGQLDSIPRLAKCYRAVEAAIGNCLCYNELTHSIE